ncbi:MAG: hypothetical protein FWE27_03140 [Defluviitaleaceae bacterium]|nr:hypothetical protein [Defluviitaleaceae bacterium]
MALKNETAYQMYLDVLDILGKNKYKTKTEKDGMSTKISVVLKDVKPCGKVFVVSAPPENRESSMYALSAHAKLIVQKETIRSEMKDKNFAEGIRSDDDGCLWYFGHTHNEWVALVDKNFAKWREKSPLYLETIAESEKLKKKKPATFEEFAELESEFNKLAATFTSISFYRDSPELAGECKKYVIDLKEKLYQKTSKALDKLKKADIPVTSTELAKIISSYENLLEKFSAIKDFDDSAEKISFCKSEISKLAGEREAASYKEATTELSALEERPETEKFFDYVHRARRYKKIARKFKSIQPYGNSKELAKKCKKLYYSFRWKIFKKVFPVLLIIAVAIVISFLVVLFIGGHFNVEHF